LPATALFDRRVSSTITGEGPVGGFLHAVDDRAGGAVFGEIGPVAEVESDVGYRFSAEKPRSSIAALSHPWRLLNGARSN
jgi:hypothetical protein